MYSNNIISKLAPCGLSCEKCFAFKHGKIIYLSKELIKNLGNFDGYAKRFVRLVGNPVFKKYPEFKEVLHYFASNSCRGCRAEDCQLNKECRVKFCYIEKKVDFCFECDDFPCSNTGFDDNLLARWKAINTRMSKVGVEQYYLEVKDKHRYE